MNVFSSYVTRHVDRAVNGKEKVCFRKSLGIGKVYGLSVRTRGEALLAPRI